MGQLEDVGVQADLADKMRDHGAGTRLVDFGRKVTLGDPVGAEAEPVADVHLLQELLERPAFQPPARSATFRPTWRAITSASKSSTAIAPTASPSACGSRSAIPTSSPIRRKDHVTIAERRSI